MNETTAAAAAPMRITITRENAREEFMRTVVAFLRPRGGTKREYLLEILRNNDCRDILAACVNEADVIGAFTNASFKNNVEVLQAFYDIGMSVDVSDRLGRTVFMHASDNGHEESICWLLDHDANVEIQSNDGWTPLMYACSYEKVAIVEMLLQKNANPDTQSKSGFTALMFASSHGHKDILQLLLNHNANTGLTNNEGKTALDLAKNEEIKEVLLNHVSSSYVLK